MIFDIFYVIDPTIRHFEETIKIQYDCILHTFMMYWSYILLLIKCSVLAQLRLISQNNSKVKNILRIMENQVYIRILILILVSLSNREDFKMANKLENGESLMKMAIKFITHIIFKESGPSAKMVQQVQQLVEALVPGTEVLLNGYIKA
jgi:hypothetical protein